MGVEHLHVIARSADGEPTMMLALVQGWFYWNVYEIGPDDRWWLARFRYRRHAQEFIRAVGSN